MTETATKARVNISTSSKKLLEKKSPLFSFGAFAVFILLISILFIANKSVWTGDLEQKQIMIDSLQNHSQELFYRLEYIKQADDARILSISENTFDSFDAQNYRVYGLYRDFSKKMTREHIANKFNVFNAGAIEYSDIVGERWFVVPIKGIHFLQTDETLSEVALKYYGSEKDSALITTFNKKIEPLHNIFIPFND